MLIKLLRVLFFMGMATGAYALFTATCVFVASEDLLFYGEDPAYVGDLAAWGLKHPWVYVLITLALLGLIPGVSEEQRVSNRNIGS